MEGSGYSMLVGGYKQNERGKEPMGGGIYGDYAAAVAESLH